MSDPYVGEIKLWAFDWAPTGWAMCDGTLLPIQQNAALYSLLGITYGGNGQTTFALPDLRGRTPIGFSTVAGNVYKMGASGGSETVVLSPVNVPSHQHDLVGYTAKGTAPGAASNNIASVAPQKASSTINFSAYLPAADWTADVALNAGSVANAGASQGHNNMQPFTVVNFCICTQGNYPMRN